MSEEEEAVGGVPYRAVWALTIHGGSPDDQMHLDLEGKITVLIDQFRDKHPTRLIETEWTPCVMNTPSRPI